VRDLDDGDDEDLVLDLVGDPVLPLANAIALLPRRLLTAPGTRVIRQPFDSVQNPRDISLGNAAQVLGDRGSKAEAISSHVTSSRQEEPRT